MHSQALRIISLFICLLSYCDFCLATEINSATKPQIIPKYRMQDYDKEIVAFYQAQQNNNMTDRVHAASQLFLGKPYLNGPLGEGPDARIDKSPLYRTDAFDCFTYVSTVLALAKSHNLLEFQNNIKKINYRANQITHSARNHFTSVDWNPKNARNGFIRDITPNILDNTKQSIAKIAEAEINRPNFFTRLGPDKIKLFTPVSDQEAQWLIDLLHAEAKQVHAEKSVMPYLPLTNLFNSDGNANENFFAQIPDGAIIEIVRPNWDLTQQIGTHLNVSHLGFAIRTAQGLMFREASSDKKQVVDLPLVEYLRGYLSSKTIKGISVQQVL